MREDLDLLDAEQLGAEAESAPGATWWKWLLGLAAAAGLTYYAVRDLPPGDLLPRRVPPGRRPW